MNDPTNVLKPCVKTPCPECAFVRTIPPGALGGSPPEVYIGQAHGPFHVPCHKQYGDRMSEDGVVDTKRVKNEAEHINACAGMAVFRANIGMDKYLPEEITRLPKDTKRVFASVPEFLAHHKQISLFKAMQELAVNPPAKMLREVMGRAGNRIILLKNEPTKE